MLRHLTQRKIHAKFIWKLAQLTIRNIHVIHYVESKSYCGLHKWRERKKIEISSLLIKVDTTFN